MTRWNFSGPHGLNTKMQLVLLAWTSFGKISTYKLQPTRVYNDRNHSLPMPEGLCPLSVKAMSIHMDRVIQGYTLQGRHVLVHCRGGVGRAGLVACTWMLKLGLVGSVEPIPEQDRTAWGFDGQLSADRLMHGQQVPVDALDLLERVVYIIRRQRSVKAIETYEQVRFLLEFIEHLRTVDAHALST